MEKQKYNIGLDIGTNSVGWAVVKSEDFKVMRKGHKKLWGARLFDEAQTAENRRLFRSTRRRLDRRRQRIKLLQEIFSDEINKVDNKFFTKMKESFYSEEDKKIKISKQENELIKKYNDKYPTIYHLRNDLMENNQKMDIRLVYLGLHHIIKNRGNFLYTGNFNIQNLNLENKTKEIFSLISQLDNYIGLDIETYEMIDYSSLEQAFLEESKKDKEIKIKEILKDYASKDFISEFTKLMIGNKAKLNKLFILDTDENISVSFKGSDYEDNFEKISENLNDNIEILEQLKQLYDMIFLKSLFKDKNNTSLSKLMISKYENHKEDLKFLKETLRNSKKEYNKMFKTKDKKICIYDNYLSNKMITKDFMNAVKKSLSGIINIDDENYEKIIFKIESEEFMPRITDTDNGKYPYQLHKAELIKIIENQGKYYPFLLEKINDEYKIEKLLTFRIPYYVGPLGGATDQKNKQNKNYWLVRNTNEKITPYNFEKVVNLSASAEKFITKMVSNCTYLLEEKAMPANSILYSKYKVLNELKQIKVDNERLTTSQIENIYNNLFLKTNKNITEAMLRNYIKASNDFIVNPNYDIKGYSANKKFANNMKSYYDFFGENGIFEGTNYKEEDAEQIIKWRTIFEDNSILKTKIEENYPSLSKEKIKKILSKKYKGWSRLSEKLLKTKYYEDETDKSKNSIMDLMEKTDKNFMQIINDDKYNFQKMINQLNKINKTEKLDYSVVEPLATSPANKRGIYQALKIVDEIVDYIGYNPENIMIEMTRNKGKKVRTQSRKDKLLNFYKDSKTSINNYEKLYKTIENIDEKEFNDEKLYLYFLQEGKSLYSGVPLKIDELNTYEVDHIIPRTLIKDDSIDNKALVLKIENQEKAAEFVLPKKFRSEVNFMWWDHLKKCHLISDKKIGRLKRSYYSEEDINGFINRQIVETSQIVKHVANILNSYYKDTKIIYLKSRLSSDFRKKYELFKYRDINDYHHMHDAYLAVVMGYYTKYFLRKTEYKKLKEENQSNYSNETYKYDKRFGYIINNIDANIYDEKTGEIYLNGKEFINTIIKNLNSFDGLISKKTEIKTGEFYNQNISKKGTKGALIKNNLDSNKYGSYSSVKPSYAAFVKYTKKNKENTRLIGIPIYIDAQSKKDESIKTNYIKQLLSLKESDSIEILKDKIPFNALLNWNEQICYLVGATDKVEVCNAKEFIIDSKHLNKWKYTLNKLLNGKTFSKQYLMDKLNCNEEILENKYDIELSEIVIYIVDKVEKEYKLYSNLLDNMKEMFKYNNIETLTIEEKEIIIKQMLNLLKANSLTGNFKLLNSKYNDRYGRTSKKNIKSVKIINKSTTGIYEVVNEF